VSTIAGLPPAVVERIRTRLEEERATLSQRLRPLGDDLDTSTATRGQGETEHVQIEVERALASTLQQAAHEAMEDVTLALARLDDGSYGLCSSCGSPIPLPRLEAVPTTRRCVPCQEHRERRA
jgi:RNA polymerase-binding protein DksA